ncbi:XRE family transcriptional regulator [Mycobacteroides abscessus]|uniref:XRE family transcriptional regulator n=1 Tax=Mycobacteroides abscessus TaxID=36809 RepID=A0ABD7HLY4_9MYCO|nr:helix-turn-helix transcriptional regulator [Mycobacteroides abscessus]RIT36767.1 XRE family transcriptional regulator [Mycobacteroides abscessus]
MDASTNPGGEAGGPDLAAKLNNLFDTMHPDGQKPDSNEKVAEKLREKGVRITSQYLSQLRSGKKKNPSVDTLVALAEYFGLRTPTYLVDRGPHPDLEAEFDYLRLLRDKKVRSIATRVSGLSDQSLMSVEAILDQVRGLEGLPPVDPSASGGT